MAADTAKGRGTRRFARISFDTVIASVALALSLFHLWVAYVPDPDIFATPPEQVLIRPADYSSREADLVEFGARRAYVNERRFGRNAVLLKEELLVRVGDREFRQIWQSHGDFVREDGDIVQKSKKAVHLMVLEPSSAISHETAYARVASTPTLGRYHES